MALLRGAAIDCGATSCAAVCPAVYVVVAVAGVVAVVLHIAIIVPHTVVIPNIIVVTHIIVVLRIVVSHVVGAVPYVANPWVSGRTSHRAAAMGIAL